MFLKLETSTKPSVITNSENNARLFDRRKVFWNETEGRMLRKGEWLKQEDLADTLEAVANNGSADYFYEGTFAENLVKEINASSERVFLTL